VIGKDGLKLDFLKVLAIKEFPRTSIKQFLDFAGYYNQFIPNFFKITEPLTIYKGKMKNLSGMKHKIKR